MLGTNRPAPHSPAVSALSDHSRDHYEMRTLPSPGPENHVYDEGPPGYDESRRDTTNHSSNLINSPYIKPLRRQWPAFLLSVVYVTLLLTAWVLTCLLSNSIKLGPVQYIDQVNADYPDWNFWTPGQVESIYAAIQVMNAVVALLTIPTLSSLLASGAVVFSQRNNKRSLSLHQVFALADRNWNDIRVIFRPYLQSSYLWLGLVLTLLGTILSSTYRVANVTKVLPTSHCSFC
jgi:hypothetical protein